MSVFDDEYDEDEYDDEYPEGQGGWGDLFGSSDADAPITEMLDSVLQALPGVARIAASSWLHGAEWGLSSSANLGGLLGRAAGTREGPVHTQAELRAAGAELLERSRDVWYDDAGHPAYARILQELAPDEARILVLLLSGGPQPSVDVRTGGAVGMVSSTLVESGFNLIGSRAGCRHHDRVPSYMHNLFRLGLVWFSREQVADPTEYQVLEAQPDVLAAARSVRHAKTVRRSIHLTPFGSDFCRAVLVDDEKGGEGLPEHVPPEG